MVAQPSPITKEKPMQKTQSLLLITRNQCHSNYYLHSLGFKAKYFIGKYKEINHRNTDSGKASPVQS